MARERRSIIGILAVVVLVLPATSLRPSRVSAQSTPGASQTAPQQNGFTTRAAAALLDQIGSGLIEHNRKRVLAAFDLAQMNDGPLFEQQITSFLAHTGIIRVHYNGIDAGMDEDRGVASVDFEMDAQPLDESLPPVRKKSHLRLVAERTASGWKLVDVDPRSFFSLAQP